MRYKQCEICGSFHRKAHSRDLEEVDRLRHLLDNWRTERWLSSREPSEPKKLEKFHVSTSSDWDISTAELAIAINDIIDFLNRDKP